MSDTPQGDGWWQTSDGLWHPPEYDPTADPDQPASSDQAPYAATPPASPTGAPPSTVPPPWSPTGRSTSTAPDDNPPPSPTTPQWGEDTPPPAAPATGSQPVTPGGAPDTAGGDQLFDQTNQAGPPTIEDPSPGTLRPGEFGLTSDLPPPSEPRVVRQAPQKVAASSPPGVPVDKPKVSPAIKLSAVLVAVLVVLLAGWYFLLRDSGSDADAVAADGSAEPGEPTVSNPEAEITDSTLPPKPTIAPGARLPVLEFNDTGDSTVNLDPPGPRVANITYSGSAPFKVTGLDANGGEVATYVDTGGPYKGAVAVDFRDDQDSRSLKVEADGPWEVRMVPVESLTAQEGAFSGAGDSVVLYSGEVGPVTIKHSGSGPFEVNTFEIKTRAVDTIVDETGTYDGSVELRGPAFVWITADGDWSVTPG